ncbi:PilW family type IVa pilus biogenesis/stability lipoprotein TapF [Aeromonas cavernicola]|uniref:Type IV pilus biogenesis/stability protein PilW n=1 Tax=Aeromonas cavernicola TaxID=1006623 RepID=A0A2H9U5X5_9GAMM|nr:PilW family type IVa pilus biogenesis/stability lipoprotein TapF [Aeromonas cavernicola]PJG59435.1 type IV pilus biogenesis/stability protein PilW [Aeromonas cavernicola]
MYSQGMNTRALIVLAVFCALPGCVTETTYTGQNSTQREVGPDLKAAAQTRLDLGIQYLRQGNTEQAKFNLDRALQYDPNNPRVQIGFAYFYQQVGNFKAAEESYKKTLDIDPLNADAMNNYGAFLCDRGRFDEADLAFNNAVAQPGYVKIADTYENAALCALQNRRNDKANEYYRLALGYNPLNPRLLLDLAELSMKDGKLPDVEAYLSRFADVSAETQSSLWLRLRLAQAMDKPALLHKFGTELVRQYPTSQQAKRYLANDY